MLQNELLLKATGLIDNQGRKIQNPDLNQMNILSKTSKTNSAALDARAHLQTKKQELIDTYNIITSQAQNGRTRFNAYCAHIAKGEHKTKKGLSVAITNRPITWTNRIIDSITETMDNVTWVDVAMFLKASHYNEFNLQTYLGGSYRIATVEHNKWQCYIQSDPDEIKISFQLHNQDSPPFYAHAVTGQSIYSARTDHWLACVTKLWTLGYMQTTFWDALIEFMQNAPLIRTIPGQMACKYYLADIMKANVNQKQYPFDHDDNTDKIYFRASFADMALL